MSTSDYFGQPAFAHHRKMMVVRRCPQFAKSAWDLDNCPVDFGDAKPDDGS
ncbi:MAG: hypothetical protein ACI91B_002705 [Planctomycetota bacterium]